MDGIITERGLTVKKSLIKKFVGFIAAKAESDKIDLEKNSISSFISHLPRENIYEIVYQEFEAWKELQNEDTTISLPILLHLLNTLDILRSFAYDDEKILQYVQTKLMSNDFCYSAAIEKIQLFRSAQMFLDAKKEIEDILNLYSLNDAYISYIIIVVALQCCTLWEMKRPYKQELSNLSSYITLSQKMKVFDEQLGAHLC